MEFIPLPFAGAFLIRLTPSEDERGMFARTFCADEFAARGLPAAFPQESLARNRYAGTLRGMHFQLEPHAEDKYVRCVRGRIYEAIVDLRSESPTFAKSMTVELDAETGTAIFVPRGFAQGYQTLADDTDVLYAMSVRYAPAASRTVRFDDPALGIAWPIADPIVSERDRSAPDLATFLASR